MIIHYAGKEYRGFPLDKILLGLQWRRYFILNDGQILDGINLLTFTNAAVIETQTGDTRNISVSLLFEQAQKHKDWDEIMSFEPKKPPASEPKKNQWAILHKTPDGWRIWMEEFFDTEEKVIKAIEDLCNEHPGREYLKANIAGSAMGALGVTWK
jgi:hypothetical protein